MIDASDSSASGMSSSMTSVDSWAGEDGPGEWWIGYGCGRLRFGPVQSRILPLSYYKGVKGC